MSLELYSLMNLFTVLFVAAGFILPAVAIYFYASYKNYWALILSAALLLLTALLVGEYIVVLLPFILPIILAGAAGIYMHKSSEEYWQSIGYVILAEFVGIVAGVLIVFLYYGRQDLAGLLAQGFRNVYETAAPNNEIAAMSINLMAQVLTLTTQGNAADLAEIDAMSIADKLDMIVPMIKTGLARALPSFMMGYGILSGVWAWFMSSLMIDRRARDKKPLKAIDEHKPHPPFAEWKLPRWLTNVLMLLLLVSIIISFAAQGPMLNAAYALQTVATVILAIQGLAVVHWWLKKKKVKNSVNVLVCVLAVMLSMVINFLLPLLGIADIMFSIRVSDEQRAAIKKKMEEIKKQVDEQMREMEERKQEEERLEQEKKEDKKQENTDDEESDEKGKDESGEEK
jgi:ABC-type multidrug transport system fused ATPase/permease subunit